MPPAEIIYHHDIINVPLGDELCAGETQHTDQHNVYALFLRRSYRQEMSSVKLEKLVSEPFRLLQNYF